MYLSMVGHESYCVRLLLRLLIPSSMMVTITLSNGPVVVPSVAFTREIWNE